MKDYKELLISDNFMFCKVLPEATGNLFDYFNHSIPGDRFTEQIDEAVQQAKNNTNWEVEYMQWRAYEMDHEYQLERAEERGRAEGQTTLAHVIELIRSGRTTESLQEEYDSETIQLASSIVASFN